MLKIKKIVVYLLLLLTIVMPSYSLADVGDFESYDSSWGSDWGSDWSYDSDWGYDSNWNSNYNYYYGYDYYGDHSGEVLGVVETIFFIAIVIIVVVVSVIAKKSGRIMNNANSNYPNAKRPSNNYNRAAYIRNQARSEEIANEVRKVDKYFNDEKFLAWTKNLFIKLQTAWSERDWETIRPLESEDLFEQHSRQLKGYINRKQINKMERISVNFAELVTFAQDNEKDILVVALNSSMADYIIDENSGRVLKGSKDNRITNTYKLTFIRKKGITTEEGTEQLKTTNCPNCGAPTTITSSGKCEFCGAVITIGAHDWVLGDMERY